MSAIVLAWVKCNHYVVNVCSDSSVNVCLQVSHHHHCCGCPGGLSLSLQPCRLPTSLLVPVTALTPQEGRCCCHCHCHCLSAVQVVSLLSVPADHGGRCHCHCRCLSLLHRKSSCRHLNLLPREVVVSVTVVCPCCTEVTWLLLPLPSPVSAAQEVVVVVVVVVVSAHNVDSTETRVHTSSIHLDKLSMHIWTCTVLTWTWKCLQTKQKLSEHVETS